ncbi:hypothetical protein [Cryobacterium sp. PAMC25264]|uniref:hypothetical protein n=1 Tax=Cryobacterium sp. PAMC25264 TaxID=2861288 RepID=UPI001C631042|nr:hypothetical protein [Cryobacterium sp. PAMC25264]QYF74875.1 hypothetical protein KY500_07000 [Cryobacterium sp. PAMC25264]
MFLIDNNALSHLTRAQRDSQFFLQCCRIPTEVIHEAKGHPDWESFKAFEYPTTGKVLSALREVMASVPTDDRTLVDLYANKGGADPVLVACALDGERDNFEHLFGPSWTIVSNDKAVRAKAEEFGIQALTRDQFADETKDAWGD